MFKCLQIKWQKFERLASCEDLHQMSNGKGPSAAVAVPRQIVVHRVHMDFRPHQVHMDFRPQVF